MTLLQTVELINYLVAIVTLPLLIIFFIYEQRRARRNEEQAIYQSLLDQYTNFMIKVMENTDLKLLRDPAGVHELNEEQQERKHALFDILITLFWRAFTLIVYKNAPEKNEHWTTWEAIIRQWCRRKDFRDTLPDLTEGTDDKFKSYIFEIATQEAVLLNTATETEQVTHQDVKASTATQRPDQQEHKARG